PIQVAFVEPSATAQVISDILFAQYTRASSINATITGYFISDASEAGLSPGLIQPGVPVTIWPEQNGAFNFSAPFLSASANSDVEVPEPTSIAFIGTILGGLLVSLRRRRDA